MARINITSPRPECPVCGKLHSRERMLLAPAAETCGEPLCDHILPTLRPGFAADRHRVLRAAEQRRRVRETARRKKAEATAGTT